eukprot:sb/3474386/
MGTLLTFLHIFNPLLPQDKYLCDCPRGYVGDNCETSLISPNYCSPSPCGANTQFCTSGITINPLVPRIRIFDEFFQFFGNSAQAAPICHVKKNLLRKHITGTSHFRNTFQSHFTAKILIQSDPDLVTSSGERNLNMSR